MINLPHVPPYIQAEQTMTHRIVPWAPSKVARWDENLPLFTLWSWGWAVWWAICTFASWLSGYGAAVNHPLITTTFFVFTAASIAWPIYHAEVVGKYKVAMGAHMGLLVDIGATSWKRLPPLERENSDGVIRRLFEAANRHDVPAARERVEALVRLERTCVVSARGATGRMDLDDIEPTITGREETNGAD